MTQLRTMPQGWKQRGQTIVQTHMPTHTQSYSAKVQASSTVKWKAKSNKPGHAEVRQ